jgi:hypothetical protein
MPTNRIRALADSSRHCRACSHVGEWVVLNNELEILRDQIRTAFPATKYYGSITTCDCDECKEIREDLRDKRWDEVPNTFIDFNSSPVSLTPEAFQAFLPAYMLRGLDDLIGERMVLEFTVYSLCPDREPDDEIADQKKRTWLSMRRNVMTSEQLQAIRNFLTFVTANAKDRESWRPIVDKAFETIWC